MDAFDRSWQSADKSPKSPLAIPAELHREVMELASEERRDRATVNLSETATLGDRRWPGRTGPPGREQRRKGPRQRPPLDQKSFVPAGYHSQL